MTTLKFNIGEVNGRLFEASVKQLIIDIKNENVILVTDCYEIDTDGNRIDEEFTKSYERNLIAHNSTLVHPLTGAYWQDLTEEEKGELEPIGEWDFFWNIAANVDVRVVDFIGLTITKNATRLLPKQRAAV